MSGKKAKGLLAIGEQEREIQNAQVLSMPLKFGDKRTYAWAKAKRTCALLAIGMLSMSSKSRDKRTYAWAKGRVLLAIGECNSECMGKFH